VIARETVLHVAKLAELSLEDDEVDAFTRDLATLVVYVEKLNEIDTEGVPPLRPVIGLARWRADEPAPCLTREEALANAPRVVAGGFAVPPFVTK
jgi:aspartyl-tRNA(Asn)/glutamyl-tRNA(Gln) amidotransferase subunit C